MKSVSRAITMTLGAGILATMFVSNAAAGSCGDLSNLQGSFVFAKASPDLKSTTPEAVEANPLGRGGFAQASIVGMWSFQFISKGNSPAIPDGALIDFGFTQWHSDGTEIQNSAGVPGGGFCMGVWGQTGYLTFEVNHFPIAFNPTTGKVANYVNLREQVTLSPSGDSFTGTGTEDIYDPQGNHLQQIAGTVEATRITVDSSIPTAIPSSAY
jgi:hypothetical protein